MEISIQQPLTAMAMSINNRETSDASVFCNDIEPLITGKLQEGERERIISRALQFSSLLENKRMVYAEVLQAFDAIDFNDPTKIVGAVRLDTVKLENLANLSAAIDGSTVMDHLLGPQIAVLRNDLLRDLVADKLPDANNLNEVWKELSGLIGKYEEGDLSHYASALAKYTTLYQQITDIVASLKKYVSSDGDNDMKVNFKQIENALNSILNRFEPPTMNGVIAGKTPENGILSNEAVDICTKLGIDPVECIHANRDGTFCIIPDLSQIKKQIANLPTSDDGIVIDGHKLSITTYNVWKSGFDAQVSRIEDSLQSRGQKYSNAYGRFETAHKTISSIIQSMADMLRAFLQF
ncbi:IpaD/SipD/SspD family type III secretion system needle tip protein [Glaciimonas sp. GNP009]